MNANSVMLAVPGSGVVADMSNVDVPPGTVKIAEIP